MPGSGRGGPANRWGWHPLTDSWARRIAAAAPVDSGDLVLDLGAGTGALTRPLLARGARVIALELHPGRLAALRELAADEPRLTVVAADATDLLLPRRAFRVVSSPPYDGSSAILDRLLSRGSRLLSADLVVQRQLARRWVEGRARGAGRWGREYRLTLGRSLPRSAFRPAPRVDSVVLQVRRR
ncbi:MAG TPA: rRNA adenine N(6)-methyltransferase family protein [Nocardioides sp.]|nr:rRNA adenine N(6)-methyltransferase family protein [Nocardioides sp.]